jgi:hypothetical protein
MNSKNCLLDSHSNHACVCWVFLSPILSNLTSIDAYHCLTNHSHSGCNNSPFLWLRLRVHLNALVINRLPCSYRNCTVHQGYGPLGGCSCHPIDFYLLVFSEHSDLNCL